MSQQVNWVCVHKTNQRFEAEAIRGNLENAGIHAVILNKQDSSYLSFGYVEIHVPENKVQEAMLLLTDEINDNFNLENGI